MYKLRELEEKDIVEINLWRRDDTLVAFFEAPFRFCNQEVEKQWYQNYMNNRTNTVKLAIVSVSEDDILGLVSLTNIDYISRKGEFNIMIGREDNKGKGIGTFATLGMLRHGFMNMNLHRIELSVLDMNSRAKHLYEKCGFKYEGKKREATYKSGEYLDVCQYSILKKEFLNMIENACER